MLMDHFTELRFLSRLLPEVHWFFFKPFLILCYLVSITDANLLDNTLEREAMSPVTHTELSLPTNLHLSHKPHWKYTSHYGEPSQPPSYEPFFISAPTSNSHLSKPSMKTSVSMPASASLLPPRLSEIAPIQPEPNTIPTGLAQPPLSPSISNCCGPDMVLKRESRECHCVYPVKLDILLLNVSSNPNWNLFLKQFASQLGLRVSQIDLINFYMVSVSGLNISMDITPHTGISFSASEAAEINSSLVMHKVHLDPALVGDYKLLNITWFKPPVSSQGCIEEERIGLLKLKEEFNKYQTWTDHPFSSWEEETNCCKWEGVNCDPITNRVLQLSLNAIIAYPPQDVFLNLSLFNPFQELQDLNLASNLLQGFHGY